MKKYREKQQKIIKNICFKQVYNDDYKSNNTKIMEEYVKIDFLENDLYSFS